MSSLEVIQTGSAAGVWVCTGMNHSRQCWFYTMLHSASSEWGELTCCLKRSLKTIGSWQLFIFMPCLKKFTCTYLLLKGCEWWQIKLIKFLFFSVRNFSSFLLLLRIYFVHHFFSSFAEQFESERKSYYYYYYYLELHNYTIKVNDASN